MERFNPGGGVRIFSTSPQSKDVPRGRYLHEVAEVARWSEDAGCEGILVYTDNSIVDPWLVSQVILQSTARLCPLVATQPAYMHPYAVAKMVASLGHLHQRATAGVPGAEDPPTGAADGRVTESIPYCRQRCVWRMLRVQAERRSVPPDLEHHTPPVAVQHRRVLGVDFVLVFAFVALPLHANQRCRLREMCIEHLSDLVPGISKTHGCGDAPGD